MLKNQNIGEVVTALKAGKHARRAGWNGKQMHVYLEEDSAHPIGDGVFKGETRREAAYLVLYVHGTQTHQPGWNASTPDLLSTDWEVLEPSETEYARRWNE